MRMIKEYRVVTKQAEVAWVTLSEAMDYAKTVNEFVTIQGPNFEVVGRFGVDEVANGVTPDGVDYSWKKRRR